MQICNSIILLQVDAAIVRIMKTRKVLSHTLLITELFQQVTFKSVNVFSLLDHLSWYLLTYSISSPAQVPHKARRLEEKDREPHRQRIPGTGQEQSADLQLPGLITYRHSVPNAPSLQIMRRTSWGYAWWKSSLLKKPLIHHVQGHNIVCTQFFGSFPVKRTSKTVEV